MGEAYSAYWNKWLERGAKTAREELATNDTSHQSPLAIFDVFTERYGGQAVFELAMANGNMPGFDVQSLLFSSATDASMLVQRWQKIAQAQSSIRFGSENTKVDFVKVLPDGEIVLSPHHIRPANLSKFGTAMLAGVFANALKNLSNEPIELYEASKAGRTRKLGDSNVGFPLSFEPTSDIIFRMLPRSARPNTLSTQSRYLYLNHLFDNKSHPFFQRLVSLLERQKAGHMNIERCAFHLGTSVRTLSRRLRSHGLSYGQVIRFVRLRHAVRQISGGETQMDEIAYYSNYADRHHMARDFRHMIQITPTQLRNLIVDSAPTKEVS